MGGSFCPRYAGCMIRLPRLASALILSTALVTISGCAASAPSMDSTAAAERYEPVMTELVAVLEEKYPDVVWSENSETRIQVDGDGCTFVVGTQRGVPSLWKSAGGWDAVAEVVNPILKTQGFEPVTKQEPEGGWTGVTSRDDNGADFDLSDKSSTLIALSVPVTDTDC